MFRAWRTVADVFQSDERLLSAWSETLWRRAHLCALRENWTALPAIPAVVVAAQAAPPKAIQRAVTKVLLETQGIEAFTREVDRRTLRWRPQEIFSQFLVTRAGDIAKLVRPRIHIVVIWLWFNAWVAKTKTLWSDGTIVLAVR